MVCWLCRDGENESHCWLCEGEKTETMAESENATPRRSSSSNVEDFDNPDGIGLAIERPAPTYLTPYTENSAMQSTEDIENSKPVRPKSFGGGSSRSAPPGDTPIFTPRYESDVCEFDYRDEGGPIVSFIRSSGVSGKPRSAEDSPRYGSIEIVRTNSHYQDQ